MVYISLKNYFNGRNFREQKLLRLSQISQIFAKVYYLEHANLKIFLAKFQ